MPQYKISLVAKLKQTNFDLDFEKQKLYKRVIKGRASFANFVVLESIKKVLEWCKRRNIKASFGSGLECAWTPDLKLITIDTNYTLERMLHSLLHECGHVLVDSRRSNRFAFGYKALGADPRIRHKISHRLTVLDEEIEAWDAGKKLASRLGLHLSSQFEAHRNSAIRTYATWAWDLKSRRSK